MNYVNKPLEEIDNRHELTALLNEAPFSVLWQHWQTARQNGASMPYRSDISPFQLKPILPIVAIFSYQSPGEIVVRLSGTQLDERQGGAMTGQNMLNFFQGDQQEAVAHVLKKTLFDPCGLMFVHTRKFSNSATSEIVSLLLPALDAVGNPRFLISMHHQLGENNLAIRGRIPISRKITEYCFIDLSTGKPV